MMTNTSSRWNRYSVCVNTAKALAAAHGVHLYCVILYMCTANLFVAVRFARVSPAINDIHGSTRVDGIHRRAEPGQSAALALVSIVSPPPWLALVSWLYGDHGMLYV